MVNPTTRLSSRETCTISSITGSRDFGRALGHRGRQKLTATIALVASFAGCASMTTLDAPTASAPSGDQAEASAISAATSPTPTAEARCTAAQFVACPTGEACTTLRGELVEARPCFDRAAEACDALQCQTGCDIYGGTPKQVLCAVNASSTGHMKQCAGYAGWGCPEEMRCEVVDDGSDDTMGTCVPIR